MEPGTIEQAAGAFETLANPLRVEILQNLWRQGRQQEVSFSTLRDGVSSDDSGRFNYHLQQLTGPFIEKEDDGYRLTPIGLAVVDTVYSGMLVPAEDIEATPIETRCGSCATQLALIYEHGFMTIRCEGCEQDLQKFLFPPRGVVARDSIDDIAAASAVYVRSAIDRTLSGVCPYCAGCISVSSLTDIDRVPEGRISLAAVCDDCQGQVTVSIAALVSFHPTVISFLHERGVETRTPLWEQDWYYELTTSVTEDEPPMIEARVSVEGDELRLMIDEEGSVVDIASR